MKAPESRHEPPGLNEAVEVFDPLGDWCARANTEVLDQGPEQSVIARITSGGWPLFHERRPLFGPGGVKLGDEIEHNAARLSLAGFT